MFTNAVLLTLSVGLIIHLNFMATKVQAEIYLYTIYYEESDCQHSAVALAGKVSGNEGYSVGGWDNTTEFCSVESTCVINNQTEICQEYLVRTGESEVRADIDPNGDIFECDATNDEVDQALCRVVEGCKSSSKLPHCNFQLATTSDIMKDLGLIRNLNAFENDGLNVQSYLMLYSDDGCKEFEGAKGIITGETPIQSTSESMACEQAVACALLPGGDTCQSYGGTNGNTVTLFTKPAASKTILCSNEDDESCDEVDPKECVRSEAYPSCWQKLVTAKALFSEPENYFVGTKYAAAAVVDGGSTTHQNETTLPPDSAAVKKGVSSKMAVGLMLGVVTSIWFSKM